MDIKDLNKSQLILLAILLSFVTSIATGITTVTLMQQAPASVTTPINHVVQQTIEKIQQVEGKTTVQTVVVKEEDLIVDAIAKNKSALFTITREVTGSDFRTTEVSAGTGFAVSNDGIIVADNTMIPDKENYYVKNSSGKFRATFLSLNKAGFSLLKIGSPLNGTDKISFTVPSFGDLNNMKEGQDLITLGNTVAVSIFEGLNSSGNIDLSVPRSNTGALVLDLDGNALGIALSPDNSASFASITDINNAVKALSSSSTSSPSNQ